MAGDVTLKATIEGDSSGLVKALNAASASATQSINQIGNQFSGLSNTIGKVSGIVGVFTTVLAGGAAFKSAVDFTINWNKEAMGLARTLGITTEQASIMNVALGDVYLTVEDMTAGANALTKNLVKKEEAFKKLGVATRDQNGHYRATTEIMADVNTKLLSIKEGTDRNVAGMTVYGKAWSESSKLLKLNVEVMAEAEKKARELGLIVGPEGVELTKQYRAAMNDVHDVLDAMKIKVGAAVIPTLTILGNWMAQEGPRAVGAFSFAIKGVLTVFEGLWNGGNLVYITLKAIGETLGTVFGGLLTAFDKIAFQGDFKGALQELKTAASMTSDHWSKALNDMERQSSASWNRISKIWSDNPAKKSNLPDGLDKKRFDGPDKDKDKDEENRLHKEQLQRIDKQLAATLAGYKADEEAAKQNALNLAAIAEYKNKALYGSDVDYAESKAKIDRDGLLKTMEVLDKEISAIKTAFTEKKAIAKNDNELELIKAEEQKASAEKIQARKTLNEELFRLNLKTSQDRIVRAQEDASRELEINYKWQSINRETKKEDEKSLRDFHALKAELAGSSYQTELAGLQDEMEALEISYAMRATTVEQYEARMTELKQIESVKRAQIERNQTSQQLGLTRGAFGSMATIADAFYQLSGKKSKEAFMAYKVLKTGETIISTSDAAMKAYSALAPIPFVGPTLATLAAGAAIAAGAVQIAAINSASPEGGGQLGSVPGGVTGGAVTQPVSQTAANAPSVTIQIHGNVIGEDKYVQEQLAPTIKQLVMRGVDFGMSPVPV